MPHNAIPPSAFPPLPNMKGTAAVLFPTSPKRPQTSVKPPSPLTLGAPSSPALFLKKGTQTGRALHLAARVTSKRSKRKRADTLVRVITVSTATKTAAKSPRHFCSEAQTTLSSALCVTVQLEALQHLANPQTKRTASGTLMARSSDVGYNSVPLAIAINAVFAASLHVYLHVYSSSAAFTVVHSVFSWRWLRCICDSQRYTGFCLCLFPYCCFFFRKLVVRCLRTDCFFEYSPITVDVHI